MPRITFFGEVPTMVTHASPLFKRVENEFASRQADEVRGVRYQCRRALIVVIAFVLAALF